MDRDAVKAFAYFMGANFQALILIGLAFKLESYLKEHYPTAFPWHYLVWPTCILVIGHSYYLIGRRILQLEEKRKKK